MRTIDRRSLAATIAAAALIGALAGIWSSGPSTAAPAAAKPSGYCGSIACESLTWLRMPLRRAAR